MYFRVTVAPDRHPRRARAADTLCLAELSGGPRTLVTRYRSTRQARGSAPLSRKVASTHSRSASAAHWLRPPDNVHTFSLCPQEAGQGGSRPRGRGVSGRGRTEKEAPSPRSAPCPMLRPPPTLTTGLRAASGQWQPQQALCVPHTRSCLARGPGHPPPGAAVFLMQSWSLPHPPHVDPGGGGGPGRHWATLGLKLVLDEACEARLHAPPTWAWVSSSVTRDRDGTRLTGWGGPRLTRADGERHILASLCSPKSGPPRSRSSPRNAGAQRPWTFSLLSIICKNVPLPVWDHVLWGGIGPVLRVGGFHCNVRLRLWCVAWLPSPSVGT